MELWESSTTQSETSRGPPNSIKSAAAWRRLADIRSVKGEFEKAIGDYTEAIRLDPRLPIRIMVRTRVPGSWMRAPEAISDMAEAIRLNPKDARAYVAQSAAYLLRKDYDLLALRMPKRLFGLPRTVPWGI